MNEVTMAGRFRTCSCLCLQEVSGYMNEWMEPVVYHVEKFDYRKEGCLLSEKPIGLFQQQKSHGKINVTLQHKHGQLSISSIFPQWTPLAGAAL